MEEGMVFILYQDSGTGFDVSTSGLNGLGLLNIFERAKIINGTAVLNSKPAEGTRWNISIPHKQEVKENPESSKS
jgi:signal transduction histidine kinase